MLIAFEGLDQSGKETQARLLAQWVSEESFVAEIISFPNYDTPIGRLIAHDLDHNSLPIRPDAMQALYIANRLEVLSEIEAKSRLNQVLICDRYKASSIAYGEAQDLSSIWLEAAQMPLPEPDLTLLLDISPRTALKRKATDRDRYERDLDLLERVRRSYIGQAKRNDGWVIIDGDRSVEVVHQCVIDAVRVILL